MLIEILVAFILIVLLLWLLGAPRNVNLVAAAVMIAVLLFLFFLDR